MVSRARELEYALGAGTKRVEDNEKETVFIQRRCCRASRKLTKGERLSADDIDILRPVSPGAFLPNQKKELLGRRMKRDVPFGESLRVEDIET